MYQRTNIFVDTKSSPCGKVKEELSVWYIDARERNIKLFSFSGTANVKLVGAVSGTQRTVWFRGKKKYVFHFIRQSMYPQLGGRACKCSFASFRIVAQQTFAFICSMFDSFPLLLLLALLFACSIQRGRNVDRSRRSRGWSGRSDPSVEETADRKKHAATTAAAAAGPIRPTAAAAAAAAAISSAPHYAHEKVFGPAYIATITVTEKETGNARHFYGHNLKARSWDCKRVFPRPSTWTRDIDICFHKVRF